jgi:hypothetical protein
MQTVVLERGAFVGGKFRKRQKAHGVFVSLHGFRVASSICAQCQAYFCVAQAPFPLSRTSL